MSQSKASIIGSTVSLTVGVGYTICAIAVALFPAAFYSFLQNLFHGANVSSLQAQESAFTFGSYFTSLVVLMVWGFALGAFYSAVYNSLSSKIKERDVSPSSSRVGLGRA
jgi:hypothetical protein